MLKGCTDGNRSTVSHNSFLYIHLSDNEDYKPGGQQRDQLSFELRLLHKTTFPEACQKIDSSREFHRLTVLGLKDT